MHTPTILAKIDAANGGVEAVSPLKLRQIYLIVGHGSRNPSANVEFETLVAAYQARRPELVMELCYLELAEPVLGDALDACALRAHSVIVVPLFLFAAGHTKNDIPLAMAQARARHPSVRFDASRTLGVHPSMVDLTYERIATLPTPSGEVSDTALLMVGRGASDPDANADFCKLARLVGEGRPFSWVMPCFIGITQPSVANALEFLARSRPQRLIVQPYFLFGGRLLKQLDTMLAEFSARYPWIQVQRGEPLGAGEQLFSLLDERLRETIDGAAPLPCDTCQYRVPIGGVADQVGGLKSMLYSIRHMVTHANAMPHEHAHLPLRKHVLVCTNSECANKGSLSLLVLLRRLVKKSGRSRDIRVTRTLCMGRCGEGPAVAVYPDGVWYRCVQPADAHDLVNDHLLQDRLVARLVDNIMQ